MLIPECLMFKVICAWEYIADFWKLWVDLVQEEIRLQSCSKQREEVDVIRLVEKTKKGSEKGFKKKDGTNTQKKDLSKIMCF
jgi:hypothetical protein